MSNELRTDVWNDMVHTDGLVRYYGELAGKLARRERAMAVATAVFATVGLVVSLVGVGTLWISVAIGLAVVSSILPLVYRVSGIVNSATYCQKRLGDLLVEWRDLWQQVDQLPRDELRERWQRLARKKNDLTSLMSSGKIDERLRDSTEEQADAYWESHGEQQVERQNDPRYALPAV